MKARNEPIGEVECPHKGCKQIAKVFRFRPRGPAERKTVFSGKLYCECSTHGRIGADGNATVNEYLLESATIWPASKGSASADASPKNQTAAKPATPATPVTTSGEKASTQSGAPAPASSSRWRPLLDLE